MRISRQMTSPRLTWYALLMPSPAIREVMLAAKVGLAVAVTAYRTAWS
jgi:hypothetical protein